MNASFEEKSVWIQLVSLVLVLGGYFVVAWQLLSTGVPTLIAFVPLFIVAVVLLVVVTVVGHILAAISGRREARDERDRVIGWRAESNSSWVLGAGVISAITGMVAGVTNVWIAHGLLLTMFLSEGLKYVLQLVYYRRGM